MSIINFSKGIDSNDLARDATKYFDELIVLYNLIGDRQDIDICTENSNGTARFILLMESKEQANELFKKLNGTFFSVYGYKYLISMAILKTSVNTTLSLMI